MSATVYHPSSYRDPSGYIFEKDGVLYRQVNKCFQADFDQFIGSGCYRELCEQGLLIPHQQLGANLTGDAEHYLTIQPERVPFISYPYEWSFSMLKDAALLTLKLAKTALQYGMILKDATPYNIQWHKGRLIFIDSLSFEKYTGQPWRPYRQFCENFLAPLLLMHYTKQSLQPLLLAWPEGIPLRVVARLLPWRSRFSIHTYLNVHLHARVSAKKGMASTQPTHLSKNKLLNLLNSLETLVQGLRTPSKKTNWSNYYEEASQRKGYLEAKTEILERWMDSLPDVATAGDMGANQGQFAQLLAKRNIRTLAADSDAASIDKLYQVLKKGGETNIHPLIIDLANPSPAIGVNNRERSAFNTRLEADLLLALALVHHLAIGRNIPFSDIASFFSSTRKYLIIEFVPATDEKTRLLLQGKSIDFIHYTEENFLAAFAKYFSVEKRAGIQDSGRTLFLMKRIPTQG